MRLNSLRVGLRGQAAMHAEITALRHQLTVLQRSQTSRRPVLTRIDRWLWVWLSRVWSMASLAALFERTYVADRPRDTKADRVVFKNSILLTLLVRLRFPL